MYSKLHKQRIVTISNKFGLATKLKVKAITNHLLILVLKARLGSPVVSSTCHLRMDCMLGYCLNSYIVSDYKSPTNPSSQS